ncbi:MAG: hypothetical protein KDB02_15105 [Acidimicrobiales bacterium]|nr:hypothetical protein [Acidimicrobiales bacterium]
MANHSNIAARLRRTRRNIALAAVPVLLLLTAAGVGMVTDGPKHASVEHAAFGNVGESRVTGPSDGSSKDETNPGSTVSTPTTASTNSSGGRVADGTDISWSDKGSSAASSGPGSGSDENDDAHFPDVPDADEHGPDPWYPPPVGPDDLAPHPIVLDLVSPIDPELGEVGQQNADGFATDVGCGGNCIIDAKARVGGRDASFTVVTNTAARIWVVIDGAIGVKDSGITRTKHWEVDFDGLAPDTTYHVTLVAEDQFGRANHRYGQIHTKQRKVTVSFTSIHVIDDADHGKLNRGEIEFFVNVDGDWKPEAHVGKQKIRSGKSIHIDADDRTFTLTGTDRMLGLAVQGIEWDKGYCSQGTYPFNGMGGGDAGECIDYATAVGTLDLDDLTVPDPALPGAHDAYFEIETTQHYLKFEVFGTVDISYV